MLIPLISEQKLDTWTAGSYLIDKNEPSNNTKRKRIYIAPLLKYLTLKALRYRSHSVICKLHRTCLYLVSIHQMAHPQTEVADI